MLLYNCFNCIVTFQSKIFSWKKIKIKGSLNLNKFDVGYFLSLSQKQYMNWSFHAFNYRRPEKISYIYYWHLIKIIIKKKS
jgi:hypothetical protein